MILYQLSILNKPDKPSRFYAYTFCVETGKFIGYRDYCKLLIGDLK